jgi:hypothetical protein
MVLRSFDIFDVPAVFFRFSFRIGTVAISVEKRYSQASGETNNNITFIAINAPQNGKNKKHLAKKEKQRPIE